MARLPLFTDDPATDPAFVHTRAADNDRARKARQNCESLWEIFEPFADNEFRIEFRSSFDVRYWEMYLTATLIRQGYEVCCPKPGPDVGIKVDGRRIWFEATSPTCGAPGSADEVPEVHFDGVAYDVPNERMVLRYLNSISEKKRQHASWLEQGIVSTQDAIVIALNPRRLGHDHADTNPPRILQAAFAVGPQYIEIDRRTMKAVGSGYHVRDAIRKASGKDVSTAVFQQEEYAWLSGLLCSRVDVANQPEDMGRDFQLVPNPNAKVALPPKFRLPSTYFRVERADSGFNVTRQE